MYIKKKKDTGALGEKIAAAYLKENGYKILGTNYRSARGEIDIIARKGHLTIFVEVKTRTGNTFGSPGESIAFEKIDRIRRTAIKYLQEKRTWEKTDIRFDVLSINIDRDLAAGMEGKCIKDRELAGIYKDFSIIEHIKDAF